MKERLEPSAGVVARGVIGKERIIPGGGVVSAGGVVLEGIGAVAGIVARGIVIKHIEAVGCIIAAAHVATQRTSASRSVVVTAVIGIKCANTCRRIFGAT